MSFWTYILRRVLLLVPQLFLISIVTFILVRLLPGDPARLQLGPLASPQGVEQLRKELRLNEPLPQQYIAYVQHLFHGDLGRSWVNGTDVLSDIGQRVPATLELIMLGVLVIIMVLVPLGALTAARGGGIFTRALKQLTLVYGLVAGALPDFWLGLLLIFIFYTALHIAPGPEGRLAIGATAPQTITGFYTVDSLLTGNFAAFSSAVSHLALPVFTLAFVYGGAVYKMTRSAMGMALRSDFTTYAEGFGLPRRTILWWALRVAAPPTIVIAGVTSGYLLGGAVLIETVFNLNGVGQYAVQAIISADYAPLQAFVLVAATFTMLVYLLVDLLHFAADPRVRSRSAT